MNLCFLISHFESLECLLTYLALALTLNISRKRARRFLYQVSLGNTDLNYYLSFLLDIKLKFVHVSNLRPVKIR